MNWNRHLQGASPHARKCLLHSAGLAALAAVVWCAAGGEAGADAPGNAPGANGIEQVVVTAQKRAQLANKIPESISVLSGKSLQDKHIVSYADITRQIPGISFGAGSSVSGSIIGPNTANITIRGISSSSGSATVAIYLDDQSITQSNLYVGAEQPKFLDMDRVEVLRGPQGTLFGASSMGGTIRLITNQPKLDVLEGSLSSDLSGTEHGGFNFRETGVVNIPLVQDKLALRIAAEDGGDSGYINRYNYLNPAQLLKADVNDEHWNEMRGTLRYHPEADLDITLSVLYQNDHTGDTPVFYPQLGLYKEDKEVTEPSRDYLFIPSLTIKKDFNDFSLTAVTGYFQRTFSFQSDGTIFNSDAFATAILDPLFPAQSAQSNAVIGTLPSQVHRTDRTYQTSQEIRANSKDAEFLGRPLTWIGGVYLEYQRQIRDDFEPITDLAQAFEEVYGTPITQTPVLNQNYPGVSYKNNLIYGDNQSLDQIQYAVFGQVEYKPLPRLTLAAGLRYLYATQNYYRNSDGIFAFGNVNPFVPPEARSYSTTPKFSATYDLGPDSILYTTIAKGFRLGGPTGPVNGNVCHGDLESVGISNPPTSYGPDKLWSYDAGLKQLLLDKRLSINLGVYYLDWTNIQQTINLPTCGASITQNFGNAASYGTEVEIRALVMDGLTLSAVGGYTHATITSSPNALAAAPGQYVLNVPKYTGTLGFDYVRPLGDRLDGFAGMDFDLIGPSHGAFSVTDPAYEQPDYTLLNGHVGVTEGPWKFMLYGKNLTDDKKIIQRPSINFVEEGYTPRPLTVGLLATRTF